jgi:hypothetical protein
MFTKQQITLMKSSIFWDIMLHNLGKVNLHFGGTYHLNFQDWRVNSACFLLHAGFLFGLLSDSQKWTWYICLKCLLTFNWPTWHYISKTELYTISIVRISNPKTTPRLNFTVYRGETTEFYLSITIFIHVSSLCVYQMAILQNSIMTLQTHYK